jgi:hypothetical protein
MAIPYQSPGVYVEEVPSVIQSIAGVSTNTVGFIGVVGTTDSSVVLQPVFLADDKYQAKLLEEQQRFIGDAAELQTKAGVEAKLGEAQTAQKTAKENYDANELQLAADGPLLKARDDARARLEAAAENATGADRTALKVAEKAIAAAQAKRAELDAAQREADAAVKQYEAALGGFAAGVTDAERMTAVRRSARERAKATVRRCVDDTFTVKVPVGQAKLCTNFSEFQDRFGKWSSFSDADVMAGDNDAIQLNGHQILSHAVYDFFNNGGSRCFVARVRGDNDGNPLLGDVQKALETMESVEEISLVAMPGYSSMRTVSDALVAHCERTRYRFAILDAPDPVTEAGEVDMELLTYDVDPPQLPARTKHAAVYFPKIQVIDPALQMQQANLDTMPSKYKGLVFAPVSGAVAGVYARTDAERGVFKAPANTGVLGALNVNHYVSRQTQDGLNPHGVNCIRSFGGELVVWGARTCGGENGEWRYVNVRRTFLYIAKSIDEGTQWAVFEPNDSRLWGKVRRNVGAFLTAEWRAGALVGATPDEAFYVKCDAENNPPDSRELGRLIIEVGISIVRPAEFVIIRITQGTALAVA